MTACWPRARSAVGARAVLKASAEDFRVTELPAFRPEGDGEHLYLHLRKTDLTTPAVADWLAQVFGVPGVAVGYAGMKDRRAVTTQWFSVHTAQDAEALTARSGVALLASARHRRKLRRGELAGNRFQVRLTEVQGDAWADGLAWLARRGAPNYFGAQRFGGDNLIRARAWLAARRPRRVGVFRQGLYLSVLRSFLFNEVLAARVRAGVWDVCLAGDVPVALPTPDLAAADVPPEVPSGPLWGRGRPPVGGAAAAFETEALAGHAALREGLEHAGLSQERRSLVLRAPDLAWRSDGDSVEVEFSLPAGGYATTLLAEAFDLVLPAWRAG
ncbi:MAG: tRNA pseudouridine(13) synthase TruD [Pseudomonadales bacterium]